MDRETAEAAAALTEILLEAQAEIRRVILVAGGVPAVPDDTWQRIMMSAGFRALDVAGRRVTVSLIVGKRNAAISCDPAPAAGESGELLIRAVEQILMPKLLS